MVLQIDIFKKIKLKILPSNKSRLDACEFFTVIMWKKNDGSGISLVKNKILAIDVECHKLLDPQTRAQYNSTPVFETIGAQNTN